MLHIKSDRFFKRHDALKKGQVFYISTDGNRMGIEKRNSSGFTMIRMSFHRDLNGIAVGGLNLDQLTDHALFHQKHDLTPVDVSDDLIVHLHL